MTKLPPIKMPTARDLYPLGPAPQESKCDAKAVAYYIVGLFGFLVGIVQLVIYIAG